MLHKGAGLVALGAGQTAWLHSSSFFQFHALHTMQQACRWYMPLTDCLLLGALHAELTAGLAATEVVEAEQKAASLKSLQGGTQA